MFGDLLKNVFERHVSEDKICLKDSYWSVEIVFTFNKREVGNVTMPQEISGPSITKS